MTFNPNIPQPNNNISTSQGQIQTNFAQTNSQFGIDHVPFNDSGSNGTGFHKKITYAAPPFPLPAPTGTQSNVYPNTISAEQELIFRNATHINQITSGGLPIWKGGTVGTTGVVDANISSATPANGAMLLPNGIAFIWMFVNSPVDGTVYPFPSTGFSGWPANGFLTNCFNIQLSAENDSGSNATRPYLYSDLTKTGFKYRSDSASIDSITVFAIGN